MMRACACIVATLLAAGCGQRGPLVLPDSAAANAPRRPAGSPAERPAPAVSASPGDPQSLDPGRPPGDTPSSVPLVPADRTEPASRTR